MPVASSAGVSKGKRGKNKAPISVMQVHRSNRSNKYDGFKTYAPRDTRVASSKVRPRLMPSIGSSSNAPRTDDAVPPPTPISTLVEIGVNRCAIPEAELTSDALLATALTADPSDDQGQLASSSQE